MTALHVGRAHVDRVAGETSVAAAERPRQVPGGVFGSYFEVEVCRGTIAIYERMGDGRTGPLVEMLHELGLDLRVRVSSPCG
jgi:hypothetical protein